MSETYIGVSLFGAEVLGSQQPGELDVSQFAVQFLLAPSYYISAEGGVNLSGVSIPGFAYTAIPGAIVLGGFAGIGKEHAATGGIITDGAAIYSASRSVITTGGIITDGAAEWSASYKYFTTTGGATTSGECWMDSSTRWKYTMESGEVYLGPDTFSDTRSITLSGTFPIYANFSTPTVGGVDISGLASIPSVSYNTSMQEGIVVGGNSSIFIAYPNYNMTGGVTTSGLSTILYEIIVEMTGFVDVDGSARIDSVERRLTAIPGTPQRTGGTPAIRVDRNYNVELEAIVVSGNTGIKINRTDVMSGGVTTSGSSEIVNAYHYVASGGKTCIDSAEVSINLTLLSGGGGVELQGSNIVLFVVGKYSGKGGAQVGGAVSTNLTFTYSGTGGISTSGSAAFAANYSYSGYSKLSRVYLFGNASYGISTHTFTSTGGIQIGSKIPTGFKFCALICNRSNLYYRYYEHNPGCSIRYVDTNGNPVKKNICASMKDVYPLDYNRRSTRLGSAKVAAVTVCQTASLQNERPETSCSAKLPL